MIDNFALIIGSMKSGTTSLFSYLEQHPEIARCSEKEPDFFLTNRNWDKGFDWYQGLWNWNPSQHKIALEGSVNYTKIPNFPNAAEKIATIDANFKFIYIMRDPIERIESHYMHNYFKGRNVTHGFASDRIKDHYINASRYAKQIDEYYCRFPAENILLLNFEDLKAQPFEVVRRVCGFLNIDPSYEFQALDTIYHSTSEKRIANPLRRSLANIELLHSITKLIPPQQKKFLQNLTSRKAQKIKLSPEQRHFVLTELREDLQKLSTKYGVDISRWNVEI
jgi:hypothetical protein